MGELYEQQGATDQAQVAYASAIEVIEGVASQLQNQEIEQTFLSARPVQEIRSKVVSLVSCQLLTPNPQPLTLNKKPRRAFTKPSRLLVGSRPSHWSYER